MKILFLLAVPVLGLAQRWAPQVSHSKASLRGVSAVSEQVAWASGSKGTWLRTTDGGTNWTAGTVPGAEELDFRGISTRDGRTVWLMSSGPGEKSTVYRTQDAGEHWELLFTNKEPKGFFDSIVFRDARHGVIFGDPVDGHMTVLTTEDGGLHWSRQNTPAALPDEAAFAASNSCLALGDKSTVWLATGGRGGARVYRSPDNGKTWTVAPTPIRNDAPSAGIFSVAFADAAKGIAVGGDYAKPTEARDNIALTSDGGRTWTAPTGASPTGFRSAAVWLEKLRLWIVTGTSGSDVSGDGGLTWKRFDDGAYNALSVAAGRVAWAVGPEGRIAKLTFPDR